MNMGILGYLRARFFKQKADIHNTTLGKHCLISPDAHLIDCSLEDYVRVAAGAALRDCTFGTCSYISLDSQLSCLDVGKFSAIGQRVRNRLGNHPSRDFVSIHPVFYSTAPRCGINFADKEYFEEYGGRVTIENDVWVGADVTLMDGITIGSGAIVGAGAVVTKDVPPYAIVGGIPAKLIRYRFSEETILNLLNFKWWDKNISWLRENYQSFHHIDTFAKRFFC